MECKGTANIRQELNKHGIARNNIFFLINYKLDCAYICDLDLLKESDIFCNINGIEYGRIVKSENLEKDYSATKKPISFELYNERFNIARDRILRGDSYLLNLTFPTQIVTSLSLESIYLSANATYKCMLLNKFVFFSPESFVKIKNNRISSFPMKGTIDASLPNSLNMLMDNYKELCEHYTIVDLIRNDMSIISKNVEVEKFRYVDRLNTATGKEILQTSSIVSGSLSPNWQNKLGDILMAVLPAGSITGAPKKMTIDIIEDAELDDRGYYTGIMGIFNGESLDSCVNIRFIEKTEGNEYLYRSGGGITCNSNSNDEYNELLTKIYVPGTF